MKNLKCYIFLFLCFLPALAFSQALKYQGRGVWIATVSNIDWPSKKTLTVEEQQKELIEMLDSFQAMNINIVVFQVRPASDVFYTSSFEPWSQFLTGKQGKAPEPFYDPLEFFITEVHARCMEAHVWLNPYRASVSANQVFAESHPYNQRKHLIKEYGGKYYFDPGYKETREYLNRIVDELVVRYDVDAIHFDDYFYPYKIEKLDFPDDDSFRADPRGFSKNQKDDWRRDNVNLIIAELQQTIKSKKPWVEFGISPFGVWRNDNKDPLGSKTRAGVTNYDDLYADILKWLKEGSIDYVVPQLYWEIGKADANYSILIDWWANNAYGRNLYIGLFASGLNNKVTKGSSWKKGNELARQLTLNTKYPQQQGVFLYSARPLLANPLGICDSLKTNYFKYPALVPPNTNIQGEASAQPKAIKVLKDGDNAFVSWDAVQGYNGKEVAYYVVYCFDGESVGNLNDPVNIVAKTAGNFLDISDYTKGLEGKYTFTVTSVNRYKHESVAVESVTKQF